MSILSLSLSHIKALLPHLPVLIRALSAHYLSPSSSPETQSWDLRTLLTVILIRSFLNRYHAHGGTHSSGTRLLTVEECQKISIPRKPTITNDISVIPYEFKVPWKHQGGIDVRDPNGPAEIRKLEELVDRCIKELALSAHGDESTATGIPFAKVWEEGGEGLWAGYRDYKKRGKHTKQSRDLSTPNHERRWDSLITDMNGLQEKLGVKHKGVIMWLHGGAYYMLDPTTHLPIAEFLSKSTGMPVFLPRYRLSPQSPFPGALVDALLAYLYLLYPPIDSLHAAYSPSQIFIGGDSAGGGLTMALTQFLAWFNTCNGNNPTITWSGAQRALPTPSGIILFSGYFDLTRCFSSKLAVNNEDGKVEHRGGDSEVSCLATDYVPHPDQGTPTKFHPSESWPATPRRTNFYSSDESILHPLVSPILVNLPAFSAINLQEVFPPTYIAVGDECLRDANFYLAHSLLRAGASVKMEYCKSMPHVWQGVVPHHKCSVRSYETVGRFVLANVCAPCEDNTGGGGEREKGEEEFVYDQVVVSCSRAETVGELRDEVLGLGGLTREELVELMRGVVGEWKRGYAKEAEGGKSGVEASTEGLNVGSQKGDLDGVVEVGKKAAGTTASVRGSRL